MKNVIKDPDDQIVVNKAALEAGENEGEDDNDAMVALGAGGDGEERGGDRVGVGDDSDDEIHPLTP